MQLLAYLLIYPFLWIISILPFPLLYLFSDFIYVVVYYVIGYRKKTVTANLKLAFPEKTEYELKQIEKKFYKHLCDIFLEMIKTLSISKAQLEKRFIVKNPEEIKRLEALNKSIMVMYGHYASYEWTVAIDNLTTYKGVGIYKKIANPYFDKLVHKIRSKFNTTLISSKKAIPEIITYTKNDIKAIYGFLSDQSPKPKNSKHWVTFMGNKVPCFIGAESIAKKLDFSVSYLNITKVKRGFYEAKFVNISDSPSTIENYKITDCFYQHLEAQIKAEPAYYLWTHKRWKHTEKAPN